MEKVYCPCKDCPDRVLGCHSKCEKYKEYSSKNEQRRNANYRECLTTMQIYEMQQERKKRASTLKRPESLKHGRKK